MRCYSIYLAHLPVVAVGDRWLFELGLTGFWARALVLKSHSRRLAGVGAGWAFHALVLIERHFLNPPLDPAAFGHAARSHLRRWRSLSGPRRNATSAAT